ncbi:hypothetical protein U0070_012421 [Myodes glareolus]|uniref:Ig-like domain-containing protein n=1 Tax=Myodes glareolus TaxID=447135 RepID=A0AAW0H6F5_MYOGA
MKTYVPTLFIFLWLQLDGLSQGEQVEQLPSTLRVQEGASAVINCTYEDSASYYFPWYKQEPGKHPKLIIDIRSNVERKQDQRLILSHDKKVKHLSLHITDTQPGDSAMYFCAASAQCSPGTCSLSSNLPQGLEPHPHPVMDSSPGFVIAILLVLARTHGDSVTQTESQMTLSEEDFLTIQCTYSASGYPALYWFMQYPGAGPQLLFRASKDNEKKSNKGFEATYDKGSTSFHLQKASVQESDSAVYYCALTDTVGETTGEAEHKLSTSDLTAELPLLGPSRSRVFHSQLLTETKSKSDANMPPTEHEIPQ